MAIPTGRPQQGGNPAAGNRSGIPTGRPPAQGGRPSGLPAPRAGGGLPTPNSGQNPAAPSNPQRRPSADSSQNPLRRPANGPQRPLPRRPEPELPDDSAFDALPDDNGFDEFNGAEDPFADVPQVKNAYDSFDSFAEEDPFKPIDDDELYEDEEDEYEEPPKKAPAPRAAPAAKVPEARVTRVSGNTKGPKRTPPKEDFSDSFMDEENLKLKQFGKKKKKVAKAGDFDARKNIEGQRKIYRGVFIGAMVAIVGFGAFQTFVPTDTLSQDEVQSIVALSMGDTGYPTQRAEGFATSFMDTLLNYSDNEVNRAERAEKLSYFYGPTAGTTGNLSDTSFAVSGGVLQDVVHGPVVFESRAISENSGSYAIGMLMRTSPSANDERKPDEKAATDLRWTVFNVNVYYDAVKDSFAIAPGSPTLLPPESVISPSEVPIAKPLGTAYDGFPTSVNSTVQGFIEGYRVSTKSNWDPIRQYVGSDAPEALKTGLGGRYTFVDPTKSTSSIKDMQVFKVDEEANTLKVDLTLEWVAINETDSRASFPSRYVMTLEKISGDDYRVAKFSPYYWVSDPAASE